MGISKFNSEGYRDTTAYEALTNIEREQKAKAYRPLVFVCSPFAGDVEQNIINARRYCDYAVRQNAIPFAPHLLYPQFMDDSDPADRELGIFFGLILLTKCDEIWVFGNTISDGMRQEITEAHKRGQIIRCFTDRCCEVQDKSFVPNEKINISNKKYEEAKNE